MQRRVLVTGASGFLGQGLIAALEAQGFAVRAAARNPDSIAGSGAVERVAMPDLAAPADWSALLDGVDDIVHLAGIAHAPGVLPDELYARINTHAVGEIAEQAKGKIGHFVLMSSVRAQAGLSAPHVLTEADAPAPTDAYGRTKLEAEHRLAASGVPYTILRPAVVYGDGVKGNIASLATIAKTPMPLPFAGLDNQRSLLARDNLNSAVVHVLQTAPHGETFLVADRAPITVADLIGAMREGLGRQPHLVKVPHGAVKRILKSFGREADWDRVAGSFVIDVSKLIGAGWTPEIETREGIVRMMQAESGALP